MPYEPLENHYFDRIHQTLEPSPTQYDRFHSAPESVDFDDPLPDF